MPFYNSILYKPLALTRLEQNRNRTRLVIVWNSNSLKYTGNRKLKSP